MSWRLLVHLAAVVFLTFAAFKMSWGSDTVVWLFLGLACWCAAYLPLDGPLAATRKRPPE